MGFQIQDGPFVQILHSPLAKHWITVQSTGFGTGFHVKVYDSLYPSISIPLMLRAQIACLLCTPESDIEISMMNVTRQVMNILLCIVIMFTLQVGTYDCGLYAVAYATALAEGLEPANFVFEQEKMRRHLFKCLTSGKLTPFPGKHSPKNDVIKVQDFIDIYCYCRMPSLSDVDMISCSKCCELFHIFCDDTIHVDSNTSEWICKNC